MVAQRLSALSGQANMGRLLLALTQAVVDLVDPSVDTDRQALQRVCALPLAALSEALFVQVQMRQSAAVALYDWAWGWGGLQC